MDDDTGRERWLGLVTQLIQLVQLIISILSS